MVLIKSLLISAFALFITASPLLRRDASPEDSITYCSTPANTNCTTTPDPSSDNIVTLPANWFGHFECYVTVDGIDRYYAGHPPAAPDANGLSKACFVNATALAPTGQEGTSQQCSKASLANCCDWLSIHPDLTIEGLQCNVVAGLATGAYRS